MTDATAPPPDYKAIEPMYAADDKKDISEVRVSVSIPGLEVKRRWTTKNFLPTTVKEEDNAVISVVYEDNSFTLTVEGKGKLTGKTWALRIRKLHHPIIKDKCRHEVKDARILIHLKKATPTSWYPELSEGLDAYEDSDDTKNEEKAPRKTKKKKKKRSSQDDSNNKRGDSDDEEGEEGEEEEESEEESSEEDSDSEDDSEEDKKSGGDQQVSEPMMA